MSAVIAYAFKISKGLCQIQDLKIKRHTHDKFISVAYISLPRAITNKQLIGNQLSFIIYLFIVLYVIQKTAKYNSLIPSEVHKSDLCFSRVKPGKLLNDHPNEFFYPHHKQSVVANNSKTDINKQQRCLSTS